jgi:hypothetical protein
VKAINFLLRREAARVVGVESVDSPGHRIRLGRKAAVELNTHIDAIGERHRAEEQDAEGE